MKNLLSNKVKEFKEKFAIWLKRPTSTFEQVADIWEKKPILDHAYKDALYMLQRDKFMFNEVCNVLMAGPALRKEQEGKTIIDIIGEEDERINENAQKIRTRIMEYLAANSVPDVPSALILTSIIIDLERLGDYTKDLSKLTPFKPLGLKNKYFLSVCMLKNKLLKMFELTASAFENKNIEEAAQVMAMHSETDKTTSELLDQLEHDKNIEGHFAVVYALFMRYFKRVAGHLQNIASSVIAPFPYLGFQKSIEFINKQKEQEKEKKKS